MNPKPTVFNIFRITAPLAAVCLIGFGLNACGRAHVDGTASGGGGNSPVPGKFSKAEFDSFGQNSVRDILKLIFQTIEMDRDRADVSLLGRVSVTGHDQALVNSIRQKLFSGRVPIYDALANANLNLQLDSCINPIDGAPRDGSANLKANTICLSYNRLASKLSAEDFGLFMVALAAHEYSHLVLTSEEEANRLQREVIDQIRMGDRDGFGILDSSIRSLNPAKNILNYIDDVLRSIKQDSDNGIDDDGTLCSHLYAINLQTALMASKVSGVYETYGIAVGGRPYSINFQEFESNFESLQDHCTAPIGNASRPTINVKLILENMRLKIKSIAGMV